MSGTSQLSNLRRELRSQIPPLCYSLLGDNLSGCQGVMLGERFQKKRLKREHYVKCDLSHSSLRFTRLGSRGMYC